MSKVSNFARQQGGQALVTMLILCSLSGLLLAGMFGAVLPSYRKTAHTKSWNLARTTAESSLDWVVDQLANSNTRGNVDIVSGTYRDSYLPINLLPSGVSSCNIRLSAVNCPKSASCYWDALDSSLTPTSAGGTYQLGNSPTPWRVARITATLNSGFTKTIQAVLMPVVTTGQSTQTNQQTVTNQLPIFQYGLASYTTITGNTPTTPIKTYGYDSSKGGNPQTSKETKNGDIAANKSIDLGNSNVGGSVTTLGSVGSGNITGSSAKVQMTATASGNVVGAQVGSGGGKGVSINVLNDGAVANPIQSQVGSSPIPTISIPAHAGAANLPSKGNVPAGMYKVNTLTSQNITVTSGPVDIFVEGSSSKIEFTGNISVSSGNPADLRIWYSGSEDVHLDNGKQMTGVLYAPNALTHFDNGGKFYGAILSKSIVLDNGSEFFFDTNLRNNKALTYTTTTTQNVTYPVASINPSGGYRVISWQEL